MKIAPLPENEASRLAALQCYQVLDTGPEDSFDDLTALAAQICDAPIALVSLIDTNRQWFKSKVGVEAAETSRDIAFCAHAILQSDIFIVPDAARDDRFADNPLVTSAPHIRFYAGMPLLTSKGEALGTLCVIDRVPRQLTPAQQDTLRRLGRQTVQLLELRRSNLEHEKTEVALRDGEARFRQVVESAPNGILMVRADGTITLVNAQIERLFGYSREELVGQAIDLLLPPGMRGSHAQNVARFFAAPSARAMGANRDLFGLHKDGREVPIEIGLTPLETPDGPHVLASIIDITERKQAEAALQARQTLLDAANKELEAFAYSVSHDLRTPLRSIDGFSQALLEDYAPLLDEQGRDYLQRVRSASQRMGQLIDDLLDLSRTARREFRRGPVDLSTVAHLTYEGLRRSDPDRQVEFVVAPGLVASGDIGLLRIVLDNLLGNAWKFTAKRPQARIEFGATVASGVTTYFIRDNGAGFDMAYADKLFTPFQRLHGMTEFPGTGIGLATVSRIVQRHGGRVWAEGAIDQGVTVYFIL